MIGGGAPINGLSGWVPSQPDYYKARYYDAEVGRFLQTDPIGNGDEGMYYLQMIAGVYAVLGLFLIAAAKNPAANRSLIFFTIFSSIVHAGIMAAQAIGDDHERGHLVGDVPALLLVAAVLGFLAPGKELSA